MVSLGVTGSMLLTACGGTDTAATPTAATAATAPTTAPVMEPTKAPAMAGGTIKIVSSLPRTGLSKGQTDTIVNAYKMALEEHKNKAGSFDITYEDMDDATAAAGKWQPETESANANKAVGDADVMVYLGTFNSGAAAVSIPILNKAGLAMISPANTGPALTKKGFDDKLLESLYDPSKPRNYFRVVTADDVQGAAAANWASELGFKNAFILHDQEVYGKGVAEQFQKQFLAKGGKVAAFEGYDAKQPEFKSLMNRVKAGGADLVYCGCLIDSGGPQLAKDLKSVGPTIQFMGPDGIVTQDFIPAAGADVSEGILGTVAGVPYQNLKGAGASFYTNYKAKFNAEPDPYAIYGYESMNVAIMAIEKAGKKDRAAILSAIAATKDYQGALGTWSFDANGDTTLTDIGAYKVVSGKWVWQKNLLAK